MTPRLLIAVLICCSALGLINFGEISPDSVTNDEKGGHPRRVDLKQTKKVSLFNNPLERNGSHATESCLGGSALSSLDGVSRTPKTKPTERRLSMDFRRHCEF